MAQFEPRSKGALPGQSQPVPLTPERRERDAGSRAVAASLDSTPNAGDFLGLDLEVKSRVSGAYTQAVCAAPPAPMSEAAREQHAQNPSLQFAPPADSHAGMIASMHPTESELQRPMPPADPQRSNSWLLELDDARAGRAGLEPVIADPSRSRAQAKRPAALDASFAEPPPVFERALPWIVRGLIASAACSFVFVVGHTLLAPKHVEPQVSQTPLAPVAPDASTSEELADPKFARTSTARANGNGQATATNARPPARVQQPASVNAGRTATSRGSVENTVAPGFEGAASSRTRTQELPTFIEIPPPDFAPTPPSYPPSTGSSTRETNVLDNVSGIGGDVLEHPTMQPNDTQPSPNSSDPVRTRRYVSDPAADAQTWWPGALYATPIATSELGPGANEIASSPERRERVARWLMVNSRGAAPLEDAQGQYAPQPCAVPDSVSVASLVPAPRPPVRPATRSTNVPAATEASTTTAGAPLAVWEGATVPVDQIASQVRILTPKVGLVRAALDTGEAQEGRLYAVGLGQVWIDTQLGRVALPRAHIERLEQLGTLPAQSPESVLAAPAAVTSPEPSPRVRVRTPGGLFYGRVLARDGSAVTLLTDDGLRITIDSGDVELAPARKTVVRRDPAATPRKAVGKGALPVVEPEYDPDNPHGLR